MHHAEPYIYNISESQLKDLFALEHFKTICKIHEELKKDEKTVCSVPIFLLELVRGMHGPYNLITYAYLVG